jgi:hypothetical protein
VPDERGTVRHIAWSDVCPCLLLARTFRLSVGMRCLLLAALALVGVAAGWRINSWLFSGSSDPGVMLWTNPDSPAYFGRWPWSGDKLFLTSEQWPRPWQGDLASWFPNTPILVAWNSIVDPFRRLFDVNLTFVQLAYLTLGCLWTLLVWSFFGGAITRIAAVALAREDRLTLPQSIRFAQSKWPSYFFGPIFPFVGVLLVTLPAILLGLIMRADIGVLIGAILWPLGLMGGAILAVIILGLALGWPLMWATISVEGTDHFDALSRAYNYIRERPLLYAFYCLVAAALGLLGRWLVILFAWGIVHLAEWAVSWGAGAARIHEILNPPPAEGMFGLGTKIISFWNGWVLLLAVAYFFSFFWVAATAVYYLMRRHVDGTELDEVQIDDEEGPFGLPPLATDAAGVPGVADVKAGATDLGADE